MTITCLSPSRTSLGECSVPRAGPATTSSAIVLTQHLEHLLCKPRGGLGLTVELRSMSTVTYVPTEQVVMVTKWLLSVLCRCVGVNNDDFLDILRNLFTEETLNNILVWLQNYWYIPVGIIVVITIVVILLPITYRKKPISKIRQRVNTLRRRVSQRGSQRNRGRNIQEAQTGGVGRNRTRGNRREHISNPRRLTESELVAVCSSKWCLWMGLLFEVRALPRESSFSLHPSGIHLLL